jgi:hypothetical protein
VIEGNGAAPEEDEGKREGGEGQGEFVSAITHQSIVEVYFRDGDGHVDADGKRRHTSKQAQQDEQAAKELGEGGEIRCPGWQSEAGDKLSMLVESTENLMVSVVYDDCAQSQAHDEECERLQTIEEAHVVPPGGTK